MNTIKTIIPATNGALANMAAKIEEGDLDGIPDFLKVENRPKTTETVMRTQTTPETARKAPPVAPAKKAAVAAPAKKATTEARKPEKQSANVVKAKAAPIKAEKPATKPKKEIKAARSGVGAIAMAAILAGSSNEDALAKVMKAHPECSSNVGCMNWYRNKLRKEGKLPAARPTNGDGKK